MPRDWSNWMSDRRAQTEFSGSDKMKEEDNEETEDHEDEDSFTKNKSDSYEHCENFVSMGSNSRSSVTSVTSADSGIFFCEEDFLEKVESLNAEKLIAWIKRLADQRKLFNENTMERCFKGEMIKADPYENIKYLDDLVDHWEGTLDPEGRLHGGCVLSLSDGGEVAGVWSHGVRNGRFYIFCPNTQTGVKFIVGQYQDGDLLGCGKIVYTNDDVLIVNFTYGSIHGLVRRFNKEGEILWIGRFDFGRPVGACWQMFPGGGYLTGQTPVTVQTQSVKCCSGPADGDCSSVTGENVTYIFPDCKTCLTGTFTQSRMVEANVARICSIEEQEVLDCILHITETLKSSSQYQGVMNIQTEPVSHLPYSFSDSFTETDLLRRDPYEEKLVEVRPSLMEGAGEGVFLKRDVRPHTVLAFYNGVRLSVEDDDDSWDKCSYRIFINKPGDSGEDDCDILDIPEDMRTVDKYCATVAHKINHSFSPVGEFRTFLHPVHGYIKCVLATQAIRQGQELTVDYKYPLYDCPDWYSRLWEQI